MYEISRDFLQELFHGYLLTCQPCQTDMLLDMLLYREFYPGNVGPIGSSSSIDYLLFTFLGVSTDIQPNDDMITADHRSPENERGACAHINATFC
jgi:hypothetical protein